MKLSEYSVDAPPTTTVPLKFANSEDIINVGIRLLTVRERADALRSARVFASQQGEAKWDRDSPVCALGMWLEIVSRATFSASDGIDVPFASTKELMEHPLLGQENLAYLYDRYETFEEGHNIRAKKLGALEVMEACYRIAEGDEDFLGSLRPGIAKALLRILAGQYVISVTSKFQSTSDDSPSTDTTETSGEPKTTPTSVSETP